MKKKILLLALAIAGTGVICDVAAKDAGRRISRIISKNLSAAQKKSGLNEKIRNEAKELYNDIDDFSAALGIVLSEYANECEVKARGPELDIERPEFKIFKRIKTARFAKGLSKKIRNELEKMYTGTIDFIYTIIDAQKTAMDESPAPKNPAFYTRNATHKKRGIFRRMTSRFSDWFASKRKEEILPLLKGAGYDKGDAGEKLVELAEAMYRDLLSEIGTKVDEALKKFKRQIEAIEDK